MNSPRILIVKLGALGDLFYALPAAQALKDAFSNAQIDWMVAESLAPVLELFPQVDRVIPVQAGLLFGGSKAEKVKVVLGARSNLASNYDAILLLHRNSMHLALVAGKGPVFQLLRKPPGFIQRQLLGGSRFSVVTPLSLHESLAIRSVTDLALVALKAPASKGWKIPFADRTQGSQIVVHLGGGENLKTEFTLKRWPKMGELLQVLLKERTERITLVGSPSERAEAEDLCQKINQPNRIQNRVGQTDLPGLVREISQAKVFVGPDSGPLHIADQLGIPSIGIYGPTSSVSWGLLGENSQAVRHDVPCHPCYKDDGVFPLCPFEQRCMVGLSVGEVANSVLAALKKVDQPT